MDRLHDITTLMPEALASGLEMLCEADRASICELRLRAGRPYAVMLAGRPVFFTDASVLSIPGERCLAPTQSDVAHTLARCSEYSLHKNAAKLNAGYITMRGGHRVGVCASFNAEGEADPAAVHSLNVRVAGEVIGCADELVRLTQSEGLSSVLIAGPPLSGKTTLLRDFARILSSAPFLHKVVAADERQELAAMNEGKSPMTLGCCCDVIDGADKRTAFNIALRALSPELVVFDELGEREDRETIARACVRGVKLAASVHAESGRKSCEVLKELASAGAFDYIVTLRSGALGSIEKVERTG